MQPFFTKKGDLEQTLDHLIKLIPTLSKQQEDLAGVLGEMKGDKNGGDFQAWTRLSDNATDWYISYKLSGQNGIWGTPLGQLVGPALHKLMVKCQGENGVLGGTQLRDSCVLDLSELDATADESVAPVIDNSDDANAWLLRRGAELE